MTDETVDELGEGIEPKPATPDQRQEQRPDASEVMGDVEEE
jgi:hypothetical protein